MSYQWGDEGQKLPPLRWQEIIAAACYIVFVGMILYLLPRVFWLVGGEPSP